jgi:Clp amino terminal domain, pathogenicity island component
MASTNTSSATFSRELEATLRRALSIAGELSSKIATVDHLLLSLLDDASAVEALAAVDVSIETLRLKLNKELEGEHFGRQQQVPPLEAIPDSAFQRVIQRAVIHVQSSGKKVVGSINVLIALYAERESRAALLLNELGASRYDLVNYNSHGIRKNRSASNTKTNDYLKAKLDDLALELTRGAQTAPEFQLKRKKISFQQREPRAQLNSRKSAAVERCKHLVEICEKKANEQPELRRLADCYKIALSRLRKDRGAYQLLISGLEIELLLKAKASTPTDSDRNLKLDVDLVYAVNSLLVAHAGLITLFPDAVAASEEIDRYRQISKNLDAFNEQVLSGPLQAIASADAVFDDPTLEISVSISKLDSFEKSNLPVPSNGSEGVKHYWVRGALTGIAQFLLSQLKQGVKVIRDASIKEIVSSLFKDPSPIIFAILTFLKGATSQLSSLADKMSAGFGWLKSLLEILHLK